MIKIKAPVTNSRDMWSNFSFPQIFLRQPHMGFVGVNKTRFFIKSENPKTQSLAFQELYINGWNSYWLMKESIWVSSRFRVSQMLKRGAEMGLSVCRTWAFSDGAGPNDLQLLPGVFNERVFKVGIFIIKIFNFFYCLGFCLIFVVSLS